MSPDNKTFVVVRRVKTIYPEGTRKHTGKTIRISGGQPPPMSEVGLPGIPPERLSKTPPPMPMGGVPRGNQDLDD